jgi:hypothetical protein
VLVATLAVAYATNKLLHSTPPTDAPPVQNNSEYNSRSGDSPYSLFPLRLRKSKNNDLKNVTSVRIIDAPAYDNLTVEPSSELREVLRAW